MSTDLDAPEHAICSHALNRAREDYRHARAEVAQARLIACKMERALRAIVDEITDDKHEDCEDFDEACESLMKILKLAQDSLRTTEATNVTEKKT